MSFLVLSSSIDLSGLSAQVLQALTGLPAPIEEDSVVRGTAVDQLDQDALDLRSKGALAHVPALSVKGDECVATIAAPDLGVARAAIDHIGAGIAHQQVFAAAAADHIAARAAGNRVVTRVREDDPSVVIDINGVAVAGADINIARIVCLLQLSASVSAVRAIHRQGIGRRTRRLVT